MIHVELYRYARRTVPVIVTCTVHVTVPVKTAGIYMDPYLYHDSTYGTRSIYTMDRYTMDRIADKSR